MVGLFFTHNSFTYQTIERTHTELTMSKFFIQNHP